MNWLKRILFKTEPVSPEVETAKLLRMISRRSFAGSLNYCASFLLVRCEGLAGQSLQTILASEVSENARVESSGAAAATDVLEALEHALDYQGDDGAHPGRRYLNSLQFQQDKATALAQIGAIVEGADYICSFELTDGHPFYPVFWDFAFLIEKANDAYIFIGSSSD